MIEISELARKHSEMISNTIEYCLREYMLENYYNVPHKVLCKSGVTMDIPKQPEITCITQRVGNWTTITYSADGREIFMVEYNGLDVRMEEYWR